MTPRPLLEGTTKGPWKAINVGGVWHVTDSGETVSLAVTMMESRGANARLIAAAPEREALLEKISKENEELRTLLDMEHFGRVTGLSQHPLTGPCAVCDLLKRAEAALKEGER